MVVIAAIGDCLAVFSLIARVGLGKIFPDEVRFALDHSPRRMN